ncbi:Kdo hydroxylase family protein [Vitiosangium sp. GDMCC 1.1324]|uniref:Kdo hydroxylase family protein n=1 Tax=Vitiosangium sp. (strain GDMCC 1.1324) TaxID=2138576 RepID=UPI00130EA780|nr:Kdo hydroxylase family protein [Vitiosangium sp. GDMCC 1.1324]
MFVSYDDARLSGCGPTTLSDELEKGNVVYFPRSPVALPAPAELDFLREEMPRQLKRKNVSYYPSADRLVGVEAPALAERTHRLLREHSGRVVEFLTRAMPDFVKGWTVGTSSFRPLQERGRNLSAHASNELVHVDAGAYGATHGDRILRFFINVHPTEDRVWATRGTFAEVYRRHGAAAGITPGSEGRSLRPGLANRMYSGLLRGAERLGARRAGMIDTSPYDRLMRQFHNYMKDTPAFIQGRDGYEEFSFPSFSAWMVLTDTVSHACLSGQFAFVDTFLIRLASCKRPEISPYQLLQRSPEPEPMRSAAA